MHLGYAPIQEPSHFVIEMNPCLACEETAMALVGETELNLGGGG